MSTNVDYRHPAYAEFLPEWNMIGDCVGGERVVKSRKERYLPHPADKKDQDDPTNKRYERYLLRASFINATGRTLSGLLGIAFNKPVKIDISGGIEYLETDIDGEGQPLTQMIRDALSQVLQRGRAGLLSDFTGSGIQSEAEKGRPYIRLFTAKEIINWRVTNGKTSLVVVHYQEPKDTDAFDLQLIDHWIELRLIEGRAYSRHWYQEGNLIAHDWVELKEATGQPLSELPWSWIGSMNNDHTPDAPPLADIAYVNIKHYQAEADIAESAHTVGQPMVALTGLTGACNGSVVTVTTLYSETPMAESVWSIDASDLALQQFRVTGIKEGEDGASFEITAVEHNPNKYTHIDTGTRIDERSISVIPPGVQSPPKHVTISSDSSVHQGMAVTTLRVTWQAVENAIAYEAEWRRDNGNWISAPRTSTQSFEVPGIYAGRYQARVRVINAAEISSIWANATETYLKGKEGNPPAPLGFKTTPILFGIQLDWGFAPNTSDTLKTEIQYSQTHDGEGVMLLADIPYPQRTHTMQGLAAGVAFYFRARLVDKSGNQSPWTDFIRGESSDDASWIVDAAGEQFLTAEAGKRLERQIDFTNEAILENSVLIGSVVQRQLKENGEMRAEILEVRTTQVTDQKAFAEKMEKVQADVGENAAAVQTKATAVFDANGDGYAIHDIGAGINYNNQFYKAGMVIGAEVKNGKVETHFGVRANQFTVVNPTNGKSESVFVIKNGQVFIKEAFLGTAVIDGAKIKDASITMAKIADGIRSDNWPHGGWNLPKNGAFEMRGSADDVHTTVDNTGLTVYDGSGTLRIKVGRT
ncbi:host specificity protein [Xenorhabdus mauleonii]|uniref:Host specificity protein n=2 Tax=Xenorhabdus mauleonii TaxID=351675 RepID=A0A1I3X0Y6_9GAMM|nr:DUF1983 domain-containing protein [Xenorhabdus mauleonii]PHM38183.1 host specificity protein [Xenorhabdus mauleonii]SFK13442.1 protein of unknown function [Xenorhabdus mauleonii]